MIRKSWYLLAKYILILLPFNAFTNLLFRINNKRLGYKFYKLKIDHPKTFNEKINYLKKYERNPNAIIVADKVAVREYVTKKIGADYLIEKIGVFKNANDINFESLPNQFVLKTNHGSGWNVICPDKSKLDKTKSIQKLNYWLGLNPFYTGREWHYAKIKPLIIGEKFVEFNAIDYKFFCFNGQAKFIQLDLGRFTNHTRSFYSIDWIKQTFGINYPIHQEEIEKPKNLEKMVELAEVLSSDFTFARIDFYNKEGNIYFGEITLHPGGGVEPFDSYESDLYFGQFLILEK